MKILKTGLPCLLFSLCAISASAQLVAHTKDATPRKPELFHDLPQQLDVPLQTVAPLLQKEVGENVSVLLKTGFLFRAVVVSKSAAAEKRYQTIVLKGTDRPASMMVTAAHAADGTVHYSGRILSLNHRDAFEITEASGRLVLEKKDLADLVTE